MAELPEAGHLELGDARLEYRFWNQAAGTEPTLVLLH